MGSELVHARFEAQIYDIEHVYDGDTINHVHFKLPDIELLKGGRKGEVYPDIFVDDYGVWIHVNVRLAGIDAPERHPRHHYPNGEPRDPNDLIREHALAMEARNVVTDLLVANHLQFEIHNPELGKYAGRVVAEVWTKNPDGNYINIADKLIDMGPAYSYEGGTKKVWGREEDDGDDDA